MFDFLFEIINVVKPNQQIFFWIDESVVAAAEVNNNGIKMILANIISAFQINGTGTQ